MDLLDTFTQIVGFLTNIGIWPLLQVGLVMFIMASVISFFIRGD